MNKVECRISFYFN